jgi:hypothetical protein
VCPGQQNTDVPQHTSCLAFPDVWQAWEYVPFFSPFVMRSIELYTDGSRENGVPGRVALLDSVPGDGGVQQPGAVLSKGTLSLLCSQQWNAAPIDPPVAVTPGHVYFIAALVTHCSMSPGGSQYWTYSSRTPSLTSPWDGLAGPWSTPSLTFGLAQLCK